MEKPTYNLKSSPDGLYHVFKSVKMKTKIHTTITKDMPYINLESASVKREIEKMQQIFKNLKEPIPVK